MPDPVRRLSVEALTLVEHGTFVDVALDRIRARLKEQGRQGARLHFLVTGTTKWRGRLDYELEHRLTRGMRRLSPEARAILRLGLFELRLGEAPEYAVVDEAVRLARVMGLGGLSGVINGVLRRACREAEPPPPEERIQRLAVTGSHPPWLLERVDAEHGPEAVEALIEWDNRPPPLWVRVDMNRMRPAEAVAVLRSEHVEVEGRCQVPGYLRLAEGTVPGMLSGLREGWLTVQDPSSALASLAAAPAMGDRILDLCAAPGGKTTHLAELGGGRVEIVATDADGERFRLLEEAIARHGSPGVKTARFIDFVAGGERYDVVLVDAPCSNLGVLRRRADARWRVTPEEVRRLSHIQYGLLERAAELVGAGGVLIYSTCTILREENQLVADRFLTHHRAFDRDAFPEAVPEAFRVEPGSAVSLPWRHALDGAFVVRMKRREPA